MREIRDHAWGTMTWTADLDPGAELSLAEMTIRAGSTSPPHRHSNCDEQVYVHHGRVTVVVDGKPRALQTGDDVRVPRGVPHHVIAATDADATLVLVWSTAQRDYEEIPPSR